MPGDNIVGLDIGTSSVRSLLFDDKFSHYAGLGSQEKYELTTRSDGSVEVEASLLLQLTIDCLDALHEQMTAGGQRAVAVGISTFWHCFVGIDKEERPTTTILHLFDTRSGQQLEELTKTFERSWIHNITGCMPHTSYWPAKLLWLRDTRPEAFKATARWLSVGEFLLLKFTGAAAESISMVSASGIWDQRNNDYCDEIVEAIGLRGDQLASIETLDEPRRSLRPEFARRWPLFNGVPWYPAYGDGACNSIGSGCTTPKRFALMIGTSGAMRVVVKTRNATIPSGIWCYRVNRERLIMGGAVSNGGEVFRWASRTFQLPSDAEEQLMGRKPGCHGLTMLPFLAGERSPYWRPELRACITGLSLSTKPADILQACLEGVSLRFKQIYKLLTRPFSEPDEIVTSGGALLRSKVWPQMMTDALGHPIVECLEPEASSRGAAMIAAEQMGLLATLDDVPVRLGKTIDPIDGHPELFSEMLDRDNQLFSEIF